MYAYCTYEIGKNNVPYVSYIWSHLVYLNTTQSYFWLLKCFVHLIAVNPVYVMTMTDCNLVLFDQLYIVHICVSQSMCGLLRLVIWQVSSSLVINT